MPLVPSATLQAALARIAKRGIEIKTVIDVGASNGSWSETAETFWPDARYHLIEAFEHWRPDLESLMRRKPNYSFTLAAGGPHDGKTLFTNSVEAPFGGTADVGKDCSDAWPVPMVSIDAEVGRYDLKAPFEVGRYDLKPPFLIKLDTHGFEREILAGASTTLLLTNLLINEFYNFQAPDKRFPPMLDLVENLGFRCIDIFDLMWRPRDDAFWQFDAAFVPCGRPEFSFTAYS
jgi:FkbM family methyltransferase